MKFGLRTCLAFAVLLTMGAPSAFAGLTVAQKSLMPQDFRYDAAFNPTNNLYLITWDRPPVSAQLADANGVPFGPRVTIATEGSSAVYTSWANVTTGGTAQDPAFLVTYVANEGKASNKYARLVRVINGQISVGPRIFLATVGAEWFAANAARPFWDSDHFIVPTRIPTATYPGPLVHNIDLAGNIIGAMFLGDQLDYEGGPSLDCTPNHVCMMTGFAQGVPFGSKGGIWARLFNGQSLQPLGPVFYLDDHSTFMDTPTVVYNSKVGKFSALWYRRTGNVVDFRQIGTDGSLGPLDLTKSFGPGAGDLGYAYNAKTGTGVLVTKVGATADLWALEIGDQGYPTGNNVLITPYDNSNWPSYSTSVTANASNGSWLVTYMLGRASGGFDATITNGGIIPRGPTPVMTLETPVAGQIRLPFDITGYAIDLGATSGTGADVIHAYAAPTSGAPLIFLGVATANLPRPDVGAAFGEQFTNSGYRLHVNSLPPGSYVLYVFMHDVLLDNFPTNRTVAVNVLQMGSDTMRVTDFDGDAQSELTVYNPSIGFWTSLKSIGAYSDASSRSWGGANYLPAPGDYDGDGKSDLGVYEKSTGWWYILLSSTGFTTSIVKNCGGTGWVPVAADYDGDGKTDIAVYNLSSGQWFGLKSSSDYTTTVNVNWGGAGFTPAPGDFDGDGKADLGVYDTSSGNWYILLSAASYTTAMARNLGGAGYDPVQGDFDGDGKTDFVVYNPSSGLWFGLLSSTGYTTTINRGWGGPGYTPVRGDYDGDGRADLAVYQRSSGNWYVLLSGANYTTTLFKNWGGADWVAVPPYQ